MNEADDLRDFEIRSPGTGAYQVKLVGRDVANVAAVVLTGPDDVATVSLRPGDYTAIIEPVGSNEAMHQSLELSADRVEAVQLHDVDFVKGPGRMSLERASFTVTGYPSVAFKRPASVPARLRAEAYIQSRASTPGGPKAIASEESEPRNFSLGLSVRHQADPERRWRRGSFAVSVSDQPDGGAALVLKRPKAWPTKPEWRLTVAVSGDRRWRMRLPLFRGGVQLILAPVETASGLDLIVSLTPLRPDRAALIANLDKMFLGSAREAVQASFPKAARSKSLLRYLMEEERDPWACTAAALLLAEADEIGNDANELRRIGKSLSFIPDMNALIAWTYARERTERGTKDREQSEKKVLKHLHSIAGHPYFARSQALGIDLLSGLSLGGSTDRIKKTAAKEWERWVNIRRRQVQAGAFLSWEDTRRSPSFMLDAANYETIATGTIKPGNVTIAQSPARRSVRDTRPPALTRPIVDDEDNWAGRFGGLQTNRGFTLGAQFARGPAEWVEVTILVTADPGVPAEKVELFLHETFHPGRVTVRFDDRVARHTVLAWGGFTVGAWIADRGIELELNLAAMESAPAAIREN